jgi:hypothetical protein
MYDIDKYGRRNKNNIQDLIKCFKIRGNYAYHILYHKKTLHFIYIMSFLSNFQKEILIIVLNCVNIFFL